MNDFEPINLHNDYNEVNGDILMILDSVELEPTPIDPQGVVPVPNVSLDSAYFKSDENFLSSLRDHLSNEEVFSLLTRDTKSFSCLGSSKLWKGDEMNQLRNYDGDDVSTDSIPSSTSSRLSSSPRTVAENTSFRPNQMHQWNQRYQELVNFRQEFGHCLVPLNWPPNPSLAHWVKRQRHQYRMKAEGSHSTLTDERQQSLESLGFVWDSHAAGWEERWKELRQYRDQHGHCRVPKKYPQNPQLAVWVKCQRRQFKLYSEGKVSNMTRERIEKLLSLGFVFRPRL